MRRAILLALMAAIASVAWADTTMMFQIGFMGDTRAHSDGLDISSQAFTSVGLNLVSFSGEWLGLLSAGSLCVPLKKSASINWVEVPASLEAYDAMIGIDGFVGPGYRFSRSRFEMIFGAGVHVGGLAFAPFASVSNSMVTCVLGAGASINVLYHLADSTGLSMSALAGYDFLEFFHFPDLPSETSFIGGFRLAITLGMRFG